MANQDALIALKSQIIALPGIDTSGYVESVNDAQNRSTTLLWKGTSPLQEQIRVLAKAAGITMNVEQRKHSRTDIDTITANIRTSAGASGWNGFTITSIQGADATNDGVTVTGYFADAQLNAKAVTADIQAQTVSFAQSIAGTSDVAVIVGPKLTLWGGSRDTDFSPFNAGGYMYDKTNQYICSSGFAINYGGTTHTTTARHCADSGYHSRDANGSNNQYGSSVAVSNAAAGRVLSGKGSKLAFDGAWNSVNYTKTVIGLADLSVNDMVCTSGGNSGVHCLVKVINLNVSLNDGYGSFPTIKGVQQTAGSAIAGGIGDSGGPVIVAYSGGTTVGAAGMIQGSLGPIAPCVGVHDNTQCSKEVEFTSMRTFINGLPGSSLYHG